MWTNKSAGSSPFGSSSTGAEVLIDKIQELAPKDDKQRALQAQAQSIALDLGQMRWLQYAQGSASISMPLLVILVFWLTTIFVSFGIFAPGNSTVFMSLFLSALSVSGAILLILELYSPYTGLIRISNVPLRDALSLLGR